MATRQRLRNLLIPQPDWYQSGPFQYDGRFLLGFIPGFVLLSSVHGTSFFIIAAPLVLLVSVLHSLGHHRYAAVGAACSLFAAIFANAYLMTPRIVQSVANVPLFVFLHLFVILVALWGLLHLEHFHKNGDASFILILEQALFIGCPPLFVFMLTWKCYMLFGIDALPLGVCIASCLAVALFVTPVMSSFSKPNTPFDSAVVQYTSLSTSLILLSLMSPIITFLFSNPSPSPLDIVWYTSLPVLLLCVLAGSALQYWTGLPQLAITVLSISSGFVVWALSSLPYQSHGGFLSQQPLAIPLFGAQLWLTSTSKGSGDNYDQHKPPSLMSPAVLAVFFIYVVAFVGLPWSISYRLQSSIPLGLVQLSIFILSISSLLVLTRWRTMPDIAWTCYHAVFILFELLLVSEGSYPVLFLVGTACIGGYLVFRLWQVGKLDQVIACACLSAHVSKLSVLINVGMGVAHPAPSFTRDISVLLITTVIANGLLFEYKMNSTKLLVHCGVLSAGLLLSMDGVITPLWLLLTNEHPSTSDLITLLTMLVAVYILLIAPPISSHDKLPHYVSSLLLGTAFTMATLQPTFSPMQLSYSMFIIVLAWFQQTDLDVHPLAVAEAWLNITKWIVLVSMVVVVMVAVKRLRRVMYLSMTLCGCATGLLATVWLCSTSPISLVGLLFVLSCGLLGLVLTRVYHHVMDTPIFIMFILECLLFAVTIAFEWLWIASPSMYNTPATKLYLGVFLLIGIVTRGFLMQFPTSHHFQSSVVVNTSLLLAYLMLLLNPIHQNFEVSVLFSSLVFLFSYNTSQQPLPLVLTLSAAMATLFSIAYITAFSQLWHTSDADLYPIIMFTIEILFLTSTLPCDVLFLDTIYSDNVYMSAKRLMLLVLPSLALLYFGSSTASYVLAAIAVVGAILSYRPIVEY